MAVDPWGDDRADIRSAFNTAALAQGADVEELITHLVGYLPVNKREDTVGPAAMRKALES